MLPHAVRPSDHLAQYCLHKLAGTLQGFRQEFFLALPGDARNGISESSQVKIHVNLLFNQAADKCR